MKKSLAMIWTEKRKQRPFFRLFLSYMAIILAPTVAIIIIYHAMCTALLEVQKEKEVRLLSDFTSVFERELDQSQNVADRIWDDDEVRDYLEECSGSWADPEAYYRGYELAVNYTDYRLTNQFIKNIYILPKNGTYLFQMPQVIPNTDRGRSTMDLPGSLGGEEEWEAWMSRMEGTDLLYGENAAGEMCVLLPRTVLSETDGETLGCIVVEMDGKKIRELLLQMLGGENGVSLLADGDGAVLMACDQLEGDAFDLENGMQWDDYIMAKGWDREDLNVVQKISQSGQWQFISMVPREALADRIGSVRYVILGVCITAILTAALICTGYWNRDCTIIRRCACEWKVNEAGTAEPEISSLQKGFEGILRWMERQREAQRESRQEERIRRILSGSYHTEEELYRDAGQAGLSIPAQVPYVLAVMKVAAREPSFFPDGVVIKDRLKACAERELPCRYLMADVNDLTYAVVLFADMEVERLRQVLNVLRAGICEGEAVAVYMGVSRPFAHILEVGTAYKNAFCFCEYAAYCNRKEPQFLEDIPESQYAVLSSEMEKKLEWTVRGGSREELECLFGQIRGHYFQNSFQRHNSLEIMRWVVLRCIGDAKETEEKQCLFQQTLNADSLWDMKMAVFSVHSYLERQNQQNAEEEAGTLKKSIEEKIKESYQKPEFNLAILADEVGMSERRLYHDFREMFDASFSSYLEQIRLEQARILLQEGSPVQRVADIVGYSSDSSFRRAFKRVMGVSPSEYQRVHWNAGAK